MKINITNVRLSFPDLFTAVKMDDGDPEAKPKFGASFLLHKERNKADIAALQKAIAAILGDKKVNEKMLKSICLIEASSKVSGKTGEPIPGYDSDHMVLVARSVRRPPVWDRNGTPLTDQDGKPYAGCYVRASVDLFLYDKVAKHGKRLCASLDAVQFMRDGEAFGASVPTSAEDAFGAPLPDEDDGM
jgi:hypothetical protein